MPTARKLRIGTLDCRVIDTGGEARCVVILCHGFGAPGDDLVPVAGELLRHLPTKDGIRFVFPTAPLSLDAEGIPGGRAWWPLDMLQLQRAIEFGEFRDRRNESPAELPAARTALQQVVETLRAETNLPLSRFVLGGFSQGSMIATDLALRLAEPPGGLIIWSGTLLSEEEWRRLAPGRAGLPVVMSHGTADSILPFQAAEWLRDLLSDARLKVNFLPFRGYHQIPPEGVRAAAGLIEAIGNGN